VAVALAALLAVAGCQSGGTPSGANEIQIAVTEDGFEPNKIAVKSGDDVTLVITRKTDQTCATEVLVPERDLRQELPLNQAVAVKLGKVEPGTIAFACPMDMVKGEVLVRE
jgi:plastocyanin domain-containing protein